MSRSIRSFPTSLAPLIALALFLALPAQAATRFWNGGGANNFWSNAANWGGSALNPGDDLIFQGGASVDATSLNNTNDFPDKTPFRTITLTGTNYILNGNAVQFTNTGVIALSGQHVGGTNTINLTLQAIEPGTFEMTTANGVLILNGEITLSQNLTNNVTGRIRYRGVLTDGGDFVKNGTGTINIEGSAGANTFSGVTRVNAGLVELGKSSAIRSCIIGDGTGTDTVRYLVNNAIGFFPVQVNSGGVLELNGFSALNGIGSLTMGGGTITMAGGTLKINGNVFGLSAATLSSISGILDLNGATRTFDIADSPGISPDMTISAVITNGGVNKNGLGNLRFSGPNTYTNLTTINAGFLFAQNALALGTTDGGTVLNGGDLLIENVTITGESMTNNSTLSQVQSTGVSAWTGPITMNQQLDFSIFTTSLNLSGAMGGSGSVRKLGTGTLIYSGTTPNTYTNTTTVIAGELDLAKTGIGGNSFLGTLIVGDGVGGVNSDIARVGPGSQLAGDLVVNSSGLVEFLTGDTFGSLSGSGNVLLTGPITIQLFTSSSTEFSGTISGAGNVTKSGSGTFTLSGTNSYTGNTSLSGGRVFINGFQPQSPVNLSAGSLNGTGVVGHVTGLAASSISPGASPGTITCSNFTPAFTTLSMELDGITPGTFDQINARGTVNLAGCNLSLSAGEGLGAVEGQPVIIVNNDGADAVVTPFTGLSEGSVISAGALKFVISYVGGSGNDVTLTLTNPPLKGISTVVVGGNGNNALDPNECDQLTLVMTNSSGGAISNISATLSAVSPHVIVLQSSSTYPPIAASSTGSNSTPFQVIVLPTAGCDSTIDLLLAVTSSAGNFASTVKLKIGSPSAPLRFNNNTFTAIPDASFIDSTNIVSGITSSVAKVTVSLYITHPSAGDLDLSLIAPDGTVVGLSHFHGGTSDDYGVDCADAGRTAFDDAAPTPIASGSAPFTNTFRPDGVLATFIGKSGSDANGAWRLRVEDDFPTSSGTLRCWSLFVSQTACTDGGGLCATCPGFVTNSVTGSDLVSTNRFVRDGSNSVCGVTKLCQGGLDLGGPFHYDVHTFTNAGGPACITAYLDTLCGDAIYAVAYLNSYTTNNLCLNYLADMGKFPSEQTGSFSFNVPAATNFVIVVTEANNGSGCDYTLLVTGTECPPVLLNIAPVASDKVRLFWPTYAISHRLESTPSLNPTNWTVLPAQPIVIGTNYNVTNNIIPNSQFFRLHRP